MKMCKNKCPEIPFKDLQNGDVFIFTDGGYINKGVYLMVDHTLDDMGQPVCITDFTHRFFEGNHPNNKFYLIDHIDLDSLKL